MEIAKFKNRDSNNLYSYPIFHNKIEAGSIVWKLEYHNSEGRLIQSFVFFDN